MKNEREKGSLEKGGRAVRNFGIVGGILGLLFGAEGIFIAGAGLAVGGEIFSRSVSKAKNQ